MSLFVRWAAICVVFGILVGAAAVAFRLALAPPRQVAITPTTQPAPARIPPPPEKTAGAAAPAPLPPPIPSTTQALDAAVRELVEDRTTSAAELIESALTLDAGNRELRIRAFVLHMSVATLRHNTADAVRLSRDDASSAEVSRRVAHAYIAALGHLESLIEDRQADPELALHLLAMLAPDRVREAYPKGYDTQSQEWFHPGNEHVLAAERAKDRYLLVVHPLMLSLPRQRKDVEYGMAFKMRWQQLAAEMALSRLGSSPRSVEHLALIKQVVARFSPWVRSCTEITRFVQQHQPSLTNRDNYRGRDCTPEEWTAFLTDLTRLDTRAIQAYGRWGLIAQNMSGAKTSRNLALLRQIVADADALLDEFEHLPYERNLEGESRTNELLFQEALRTRNQAAMMVIPAIKQREPPRQPVTPRTPRAPHPLTWPPYRATGPTLDALNIVPRR